MKPLEQIEKELREAIISAVPEIMELKFGCRTRTGRNLIFEYIISFADDMFVYLLDPPSGEIRVPKASFKDEIIGRPITFSDVMRTIGKTDVMYFVSSEGKFFVWNRGESIPDHYGAEWNFSQPLEDQSEETKRFLHSIICKENI